MTNSTSHTTSNDMAIALIGMSGRFPGARNVEEFWQNVLTGVKSIRSFSDEELLAAGVNPALLTQPNYVKAGAVLEDADKFDAPFFKFSPREAEITDPQHRVFLECAWEALEDAGYDPETYQDLIGVFAGSAFSTYLLHNLFPNSEVMDIVGYIQASIGNDKDSLASTVSYKFNLRGPAIAVQTFCSTSLVATHLACQSLLNYECDIALAGGVAIAVPQTAGYVYEEGGILSPDGECRAFDENGRGSVMGNGVGVVALKRLEEALEDGDQIYAVVLGSAINNDGSMRVSYTAPGLGGQTEVIAQALSNAAIDVETVGYIEAHGTATMLGDSVELAAMKKAFGRSTQKKQFCAIGSAKPNVGHLDRASGVTGLIKTSLALKHKLLPPSLNFERASEEVDLNNSPFYVNTRQRAWQTDGTPRRAGVSSFGVGGTNAHVVLEEAPEIEPSSPAKPWQLLIVSAKTPEALDAATINLATHLKTHTDLNLADVACTLQVGRAAFNHRRFVVCRNHTDAIAALESAFAASSQAAYQVHRDRPVAFLLPDLGEHYAGIAQELYEEEPVFQETVDRCATFLHENPSDIIGAISRDSSGSELAQSAFFVVEYALAQLLQHWGLRPQMLLGSGVGEYVAACLAGIFSVEDALTLVMRRAQLMNAVPEGAFVEELNALLQTVTLNPPEIPCLSNLTGTWLTTEQAVDITYWMQHMCQAGSVAASVTQLLHGSEYVLLEVGPGQALATLIEQYPAYNDERTSQVIATMSLTSEHQFARAALLTALGQLWLAGVTIAWPKLYDNERRLRVSLPTYPFARQRHWLEAPHTQVADVRAPVHARIRKELDKAHWFYRSRWDQIPLPEHTPLAQQSWLAFLDTTGLGEQVVQQLVQQGHSVVRVYMGTQFAQLDEQVFSIRPSESADYIRLCDALVTSKQLPQRILHCWSVSDEGETTPGNVTTFQAQQERGFYSLLFLTQALSAHTYETALQMIVVSTHAQDVTGYELLQPEKATILGACKVISQEPLNISCRSIDIEILATGQHTPVVAQLVAECTRPTGDLVVAYRAENRWVQNYEAVSLSPAASEKIPFRRQGVYLITGGLGGIGLSLADHLARTQQARIVLVGRSGIPERNEWQAWLDTHDSNESISQKIRQVQAVEAHGGRVLLCKVDVADEEQMRAVVQETLATFGGLHGVFHAAGITAPDAFKTIQDTGRDGCEIHFQSKVYGTYALEQALVGLTLDFCLLFSSLSAVLGGLGFVAYTAANIFLDAFVTRHNQKTTTCPWTSVNWDTWQVREDVHGALGATVLAFAMTPDEGIEALTRVLASGETHIVNSTGDLQARISQWIHLESLQQANEDHVGGASTAPVIGEDYERKIAEIWQQVLGVEQVGLYDNFFDLGGNSLVALDVISRLKRALHMQIPAVALFEAPTVSALATYLCPTPVTTTTASEKQRDVLFKRRRQVKQATQQEGIAIIGMSGRFPGAATIDQFWQNLRDGVESITRFDDAELLAAGVDPADLRNPDYVKARPVLEQVDQFDASFFGYSPREAELTDPQHRLFLECSWEAFEQAGYDTLSYEGLIGVFGGTNMSTYLLSLVENSPDILRSMDGFQIGIGNDKDSLTTTVSYKLNLRGPSFAVQTFCSTSLVATHLACQSLLHGECDIALAGGVSIRVPDRVGYWYQEGGQESSDGHCRTFDAQSQGSVLGDGVGAVVLKRLSDALEDGDTILAVIKGSAINNDGSLKVSYSAPSVAGQAEVVTSALANAGIDAESISYIEAHGTATELGDPIEVASLTKAFRACTDRVGYCAIGSLKTNMGHLDRASGVAGLIKAVLALQHEQIPASLHYQSPNREIDFEHSPFYVNSQLRSWPRSETPRRAGVNSLGMGGTNVHVVVEESPELLPSSPSRPWQLLLLSAKTESALQTATRNLQEYLRTHEEADLADVAYTLQVGRSVFDHRRILLCRNREDAIAALQSSDAGRNCTSYQGHRNRAVAFIFPDEDAQFAGTTLELYQQEATFRETIDRCCTILKQQFGLDLYAVLYHSTIQAVVQEEQITQTYLATFIIEYALAQLLMQWGLRPQAMLGSKLGEYVAACLAGVFSLEDALTLVMLRASLFSQSAMSLTEAAIELPPSLKLNSPQIPFISHMTGTWITVEEATNPSYWSQHTYQDARFTDGIAHLLQDTEYVPLEVGPGQSLSLLIKQHPAYNCERLPVIATLCGDNECHSSGMALLNALGQLWLAGVTPDWAGFYAGERRRRIPLPTYPFERRRYWLETRKKSAQIGEPQTARKLIERTPDIADWFYRSQWQQAPLTEATPPPARYSWLVFMDSSGLGAQIGEKLSQQGYSVVDVHAGEAFAQLDEQNFRIRPGESADYVKLCDALASANQLPRRVLHGWGVTIEAMPTDSSTFRAGQELGFYSLLFLTRALSVHVFDDPVQIIALTTSAQPVTGNEVLRPEKASIVAACKVIPQEPLNIACRSIDVDGSASGIWAGNSMVEQLVAECTRPATDLFVAYRAGTRWIQHYEAVSLPPATTESMPFRQHGVYLITGGLGGIGLTLAEHLARTVQARIVLVGRSGLPSRQEWQNWLTTHADDDSVSQKIQRLQAIEVLGGEVQVYKADVADTAQMQAVVKEILTTFGTLHGVFHAAGIVDESVFKSVQDIHRAECEIHFQSKVHGTYALAQALQGIEIDFCLLFSSLSAVLGGLGFVAYTAANMFLDAFAYQHNATGAAPWISVNWDTWQVRENPHGSLGGTIAAFAMQPSEAIDALTRVLASGNTHLVNSTGDLHARLQQWIRTDLLHESNASLLNTKKSSNLVPTSGDYEQKITEVWQEVLGIQDVGLYDNFFDLGGNSLIALEVINKLKKAFHMQIPAVALFEAPTISSLTAYLQPAAEPEPVEAQEMLVERRQQTRSTKAAQGIALIGMSGRFPGAASVEQFWQNLSAGVESISFFTPAELEAAGVDPALIHAPNYVPARPVLPAEVVEYFDAPFFGYSPREAELTDPQHRLFLECAWEALEQAGYDSQTYKGLIGVFGGTNISTYVLSADPAQLGGVNNYQLLAGNDKDSLTSSVSYKLNLRGPSLAVQTFCSTSLVAVHLASQSLLNGECDLALAGGVSVQVPSIGGHLYEPGGMESPDGHCRTFDAQAHGSMFGDGAGVVVLKRLNDAVADGDVILAVVKGSAINNDGSLKVSYAAPSVVGQSEVVQAALANAGVPAESISYVEAHGTATELGDPIEVTSLTKAFSSQTEKTGYCAIGSVKTNVGHLDRAAGVSGLIKTVLSLQYEQIPASLHYQSPNPEINFAHSPFYVNTQLRPWPRTGIPRRAGINSLGMGGTNAHVVLEEAPQREPSGPSRPCQLLLFSARTPTALAQVQHNVGDFLRQHEEINLADVAYTLQVGRRRFEQRSMLLCRDRDEAIRLLEAGELSAPWTEQRIDRPVAFLFPGIGEQYIGMTQELYRQEDIFHTAIDRCCSILKGILDVNICDVLFSEEMLPGQNGNGHNNHDHNALNLRALLGRAEGQNGNGHNGHNGHAGQNGHNGHKGVGALENAERLKQTALGQPIMFVIEYALAQLLMQWGIQPQAMLGYSLGEYVAACLAGVLSLEDALLLVARRAQFIGELPAGTMIAVSLSEEDARIYTDENVSLAVVNGPHTCVLAGSPQAIEDVVMQLEWNGVAFRYVEATHAFHSKMLESVQARLTALVRTLTLNPPTMPYISNVTGTWITAEQATNPDYWAQHMCCTVRFADGVSTLIKDTEYVLLEVGPGQALASFVKQNPHCDRVRASLVMSTLPSVYERQPEHAFLLQSLGKLWLSGVSIDWQGFYAGERRLRIPLPTYPFERQRYWLEPRKDRSGSPGFVSSSPKDAVSTLKREELTNWFYLPGWKHSAPVQPVDAAQQDMSCWLLFLDHGSVGIQLREQLGMQFRDVITVSPGEKFAQLSDTHYSVQPRSRADYDALLKNMRMQGKTPRNIVHLWMVTGEQPEVDGVLDKGFYSLFVLAQALGDADLEQCCITIISSEMQNVTGNEQICPAKSTIIGPCRVIPQEYPNLSCRSIDIVVPVSGSWQEEALLHQLQAELLTDARDTVVALRGNRRWVPSFEPMPLDQTSQQFAPLRKGGVYLITGGLGGIGLAMAKHLAREVQARLVLIGRTGLPPRQEWPTVLASQGETEGVGRRIHEVLALESLGAEVLVIQTDVTSEAHMRAAVEQAVTTFGALSGVIHAAGVPGIGLTQLKTLEQAAQVLAPKVRGALVLERVLRDHALDFLVLFSSVTSTTGGGPGQIDYCAANAFLDAFAYSHAGKPGVTIAIDWGEWQWNAWEAGLAGYDSEVQKFLREHRQEFGIAFEDGYDALRRALSTGLPHVVVSTQDFRVIADQSKLFTAAYILQQEREITSARAVHPRPSLAGSYVPPRNAVEQQIVSLWEELLGISPVGINDNFFELGGNSLTGIDLIARLRKAFNLETLPSHVLYEAPSVSAMAQYIEKGKTTGAVKERVERGEKRRDSLKQRMRESRRTR